MEEGNEIAVGIIDSLFNGISAFHDKEPLVSNIGFLLVCACCPLFFVLKYVYNVKKSDNEVVKAKYNAIANSVTGSTGNVEVTDGSLTVRKTDSGGQS